MIKAWGSEEKAREVVYRAYDEVMGDPITAALRGERARRNGINQT